MTSPIKQLLGDPLHGSNWIPYMLIIAMGGGNFLFTESKSADRFTGADGEALRDEVIALEAAVGNMYQHGPLPIRARLDQIHIMMLQYGEGEKNVRKQHDKMADQIDDLYEACKRAIK